MFYVIDLVNNATDLANSPMTLFRDIWPKSSKN